MRTIGQGKLFKILAASRAEKAYRWVAFLLVPYPFFFVAKRHSAATQLIAFPNTLHTIPWSCDKQMSITVGCALRITRKSRTADDFTMVGV